MSSAFSWIGFFGCGVDFFLACLDPNFCCLSVRAWMIACSSLAKASCSLGEHWLAICFSSLHGWALRSVLATVVRPSLSQMTLALSSACSLGTPCSIKRFCNDIVRSPPVVPPKLSSFGTTTRLALPEVIRWCSKRPLQAIAVVALTGLNWPR